MFQVLVVDQILIGGLSPGSVTLSSGRFDIFVRVGAPLYKPVPYACFLRSSASQLLQTIKALIVGEHLLKCTFEKAASSGMYQVGISAKADLRP